MGMHNLILFFVLVLVSSIVFVTGEGGVFKVKHKFGSGGGIFKVKHKFGSEGGVCKVKHKFGGEANRSLKDLTVHDKNRYGRLLAAIDIPLGGDGKATGTGILAIGSPPKDYFLHVDTGSDIYGLTVSSVSLLTLKRYDPKNSSTAELVPCSGGFCTDNNKGLIPGCLSSGGCGYGLQYGDGSGSVGYFVKDFIGYDQVSGNLHTIVGNSSSCGTRQTGNLASSIGALDGLIGFGASNTSMLSQLASSGKVKKKFAHCLDGKNGGGIFAIGNVVQPTVKTPALVPNATYYKVKMESFQVGNKILDIPKRVFQAGNETGTIIDSGTTLAYLPGEIFDPLRRIPGNLNIHLVDDLIECFRFDKSTSTQFFFIRHNYADFTINILVFDKIYPSGGWQLVYNPDVQYIYLPPHPPILITLLMTKVVLYSQDFDYFLISCLHIHIFFLSSALLSNCILI
ncbi:hypothetical protein MKX01_003589 [Papaver californicum]|nr:hypothetical protein MKX01_003589 [Papaver californicum]